MTTKHYTCSGLERQNGIKKQDVAMSIMHDYIYKKLQASN